MALAAGYTENANGKIEDKEGRVLESVADFENLVKQNQRDGVKSFILPGVPDKNRPDDG